MIPNELVIDKRHMLPTLRLAASFHKLGICYNLFSHECIHAAYKISKLTCKYVVSYSYKGRHFADGTICYMVTSTVILSPKPCSIACLFCYWEVTI